MDPADTETNLGALADDDLTPVPAPAGVTLSLEKAAADKKSRALRTVVYLMVFRVGLATLLLASVVVVALTQDSPDKLAGPFGRFVFALLASTYMASVAYGVALKHIINPMRFVYLQIGIDMALISVLVHATGGANSGYQFLYMVDIIAVALLPTRNATLWVAGACALFLSGTCLAGYLEWVAPVPGQTVFPWDIPQREFLFRLVLNLAGVVSVGALGYTLSSQSREAGLRLERHEQFAGDLASLHENTIRCLSSGLVTTTRSGIVTSINEAASEILGIQREQALRKPLSDHIPGVGPLLEEVGLAGQVRRRELDAVRPDGNIRRLGLSGTPLTDHAGGTIGRVFHFQDLTDLRRMEVQVHRAERLASIGRLAAGIAHEIRNPLAGISGAVETLRAMQTDDEDSQMLGQIVIREVDRLNKLITSMLDYARPPGSELAKVDLSQLIKEVSNSFRQGQPRSQLVLSVETQIVMEASPNGVRQVIWNLFHNADEAMPKGRETGNEIRIHLSQEEVTTGEAEAVIIVTDNGNGIPPDVMEHIFEPFFTQGKAKGTGLGLAMVARLVEDHEGTIDVDSRVGQGTTFTVRLPIIDPRVRHASRALGSPIPRS